MIKAILFDFDGVLTIDKTCSASITAYIAQVSGLPLELVRQSYAHYNRRLLYDGMRHEEMWPDFCKAVGRNIDYQVLIDSFVHTPLDEEMLSLVRALRKSYLTGMITDNKADRINVILEKRQLGDCFDVVAVSANLHCGKDRPDIFEYAAQTLQVRPDECVFIDNEAKNLIVPEQLGMKTILFDDSVRDISAFKATLHGLLKENTLQ